ncbi:MAG TPA: cation diffusion facilitator family transporter [Gemmatimonadales bacterium]|nr:cation diffusion facilitator family transporter [Gemmatimonadales bacterium]
MSITLRRGMRLAKVGIAINSLLALVKLFTGYVGHSYALIADGIESTADIFSSLVVWSGLRISTRSADDRYPFGYGKAEALAGAIVSLMLLAAALAIAVESVREIITPHHAPAPFTLVVLVVVMIIKEMLFRRVAAAGQEAGSTALHADAWHHRADVITSGCAFVGISIALIGGEGWEMADDWAALFAATIIAYNGVGLLRPAVADLMDRTPAGDLADRIAAAAVGVAEVRAIEKLKIRKAGVEYFVDLHVQADPAMSLHDAHIVSGKVKSAIRTAVPAVSGVLIHMEPFGD